MGHDKTESATLSAAKWQKIHAPGFEYRPTVPGNDWVYELLYGTIPRTI
jgi:hypothetical protein